MCLVGHLQVTRMITHTIVTPGARESFALESVSDLAQKFV